MRKLLLIVAIVANMQANVTEVTKESDIAKNGYAIVKFYAEWCGPCKMFKPEFEELATKYSSKGNFYAVNADTQSDILTKYNVSSLPTVAILNNGEFIEKFGASQLEDKLKELKPSSNVKEVTKKETVKRKVTAVKETKSTQEKTPCSKCNCDKK